jgi:hypothetical protein
MFVLEFLPKFVQKQTKNRSTSMRKIRNLRHNKQHGVIEDPRTVHSLYRLVDVFG